MWILWRASRNLPFSEGQSAVIHHRGILIRSRGRIPDRTNTPARMNTAGRAVILAGMNTLFRAAIPVRPNAAAKADIHSRGHIRNRMNIPGGSKAHSRECLQIPEIEEPGECNDIPIVRALLKAFHEMGMLSHTWKLGAAKGP